MKTLFPEATFITFLTGFLGSGKTTTLNVLLRDERLRDTAIIVNEFGEVGLDHFLISQSEENVVLLDSGCICCTIGNGLGETLETLYRHRLQGRVPNFTRVIVETTGLADPMAMLRLTLADYFISKHFVINGVLTTVDAINGLNQLKNHREARNQVSMASWITVTKTDLSSERDVQILKEAVKRLNADAVITESHRSLNGAVTLSQEVFDLLYQQSDVQGWLREKVRLDGREGNHSNDHPDHHRGHDHGHSHAHDGARGTFDHDNAIDSYAFYWDEPVPWTRYAAWLQELRTIPSEDLMRVKGLVALGDARKPYVIQGVQHVFAEPVRLDAWPSDDERSRLVVIARGVQREALEQIFSKKPEERA